MLILSGPILGQCNWLRPEHGGLESTRPSDRRCQVHVSVVVVSLSLSCGQTRLNDVFELLLYFSRPTSNRERPTESPASTRDRDRARKIASTLPRPTTCPPIRNAVSFPTHTFSLPCCVSFSALSVLVNRSVLTEHSFNTDVLIMFLCTSSTKHYLRRSMVSRSSRSPGLGSLVSLVICDGNYRIPGVHHLVFDLRAICLSVSLAF